MAGGGCGHAVARSSSIQRQCDYNARRSSTMDIWKLCLALNLMQLIFVRSEERVRSWSKSREKRFLIWTDSGSSKMSISMSIPASLYDKKKWRSFNLTYNIQFQYSIPNKPFYWWNATYWKLSRSNGADNFVEAPATSDFTQMYIYAALRNYMNNSGLDGQQCMQRVICQNAQVGRVEGFIERVYQRLLTPEDTSEEYYRDAYVEGSKGVDCLQTYSGCPMGRCLLDQIVQYA